MRFELLLGLPSWFQDLKQPVRPPTSLCVATIGSEERIITAFLQRLFGKMRLAELFNLARAPAGLDPQCTELVQAPAHGAHSLPA